MRSFKSIITGIFPFVIFPYCLVILFVICYYALMKYRIWRDIRNVCYPPTIKIDRNKFKLNLQIKSMVYSFILILSITELVANILFQSSQISKFNSKIIIVYPEIISEDCVIESTYMIQLLNKSTFMIARAQNIGIVLWTMFSILLSLFFVILRHMYLNHPYNKCTRKYIIYIFLQFVVKTSLSCFMQTWYISQLLYFPMGVVDVCVYIFTSHKFYLLLKGRRDEAIFHSTQTEYFQKVHIVNRFFFIQVGTLVMFLMLLLTGLFSFILVPINILNYNPCFLSYITLGLIPNFVIPKQIQEVTLLIQLYCYTLSSYLALLLSCYLSPVTVTEHKDNYGTVSKLYEAYSQ